MSREQFYWLGMLLLAGTLIVFGWQLIRKGDVYTDILVEAGVITIIVGLVLFCASYEWAGQLFFESQYPEPQQEVAKDGSTGN